MAHFTFEFPPASTGGLGRHLGPLVDYQRSAGDKVDVYFLGDGEASADCVPLPGFDDNEPIVHPREWFGSAAYDVVVCHDWPAVVAAQPLWSRGVPMVFTWHLPLDWDPGWFGDISCVSAPHIEFTGLLAARSVVAMSRAIRGKAAAEHPFTRAKTVLVYGGTDVDFFRPDPGGSAPATPSLLFVGRYCEQKGFDLLPDVLRLVADRVPQVRLDVIGIGPLQAQVEARFADLGLTDRVSWHPFSGPEVVRQLFRDAGATLAPSRYEPFGLAVVEAMASGAALVAGRTGGIAETVQHGMSGLLVAPDDVTGFADAAVNVLLDAALAQQLRQGARSRAVNEFSDRRCFETLRAVYQSAAADR